MPPKDHWRHPPDGDVGAWLGELRARTHELKGLIGAVELLCRELQREVRKQVDTDRLEREVERRLRERGVFRLSMSAKLIGIAVLCLQAITFGKGLLH